MQWNPMESNSIPRNWNGIGIENSKISGIGMELELKFENSVEQEWKWNISQWNWNGIGIENSELFNNQLQALDRI